MKYKIYKLVYKEEVVYIGKTTQTLNRRKSAGYKFIPFFKECQIELIEETNDVAREKYWIQTHLEIGCNLLNKRKGSTGLTKKEYAKTDKMKEYQKEYRTENKDQKKEYCQNNKERIKENTTEYYQNNKGKIKIY